MKPEDVTPITSEEELHDGPHDKLQPAQKNEWGAGPFHFGASKIPHHTSSTVQLTLVGIIFLCGPGILGALTGLGGGGLGNPIAVNNSLIATYGTSAVFGFFSGPICSKLGFRMSLVLGSAAYTLHTACILVYKHTQTGWLIAVSGVIVGILSSFSWTALGAMLMSYPTPEAKGKWMSLNLIYFNGGVTLGSIVVFFENLRSASTSINDATYIAFIVIVAISIPLSCFIIKTEHVVRTDKSMVTLINPPSWNTTIIKFAQRLRSDPYIIAIFPMLFVSNFNLPYVFNDINLANFNIRTRALNVILFYAAGSPGAYLSGYLLDLKVLSRRARTRVAIVTLCLLFMAMWGGTYAWQKNVTRQEASSPDFKRIDCTSSKYIGPIFLFIAFGFVHWLFQNTIYWFLAALADNSETAAPADFAGFFKSLQGVGSACAWRVSNEELPFLVDLAITWGLVMASLLIAAPVLMSRIKDEVIDKEDESQNHGLAPLDGIPPMYNSAAAKMVESA